MSAPNTTIPPRKWLMDRINGESKYGDGERPWNPCCWVPPPVGWCPGLLEDNALCQGWGWVGGYSGESARYWLMNLGFVANLCACILTAYACFSISEDFNLITKSSFGSLSMTELNDKFKEEITLEVGLRAVALNNPVEDVDNVVIRFDQFCDLSTAGLERYMDPEDCASCNDISTNLVISVIIAVISFLPSFFTDILRMYSGYDVNCQKCFGTFFSLCSVGLILNVLFTYKFYCGDKFYQNRIMLDDNGNALPSGTPPEQAEYVLDYNYKWGWGMLFLLVAACLKFFQVMCHICIPTPSVTRDAKEQQIYEKVKDEDFP
jgi:hypothetical protein